MSVTSLALLALYAISTKGDASPIGTVHGFKKVGDNKKADKNTFVFIDIEALKKSAGVEIDISNIVIGESSFRPLLNDEVKDVDFKSVEKSLKVGPVDATSAAQSSAKMKKTGDESKESIKVGSKDNGPEMPQSVKLLKARRKRTLEQ